jgi:hypothetical protein
MEQILHQGQSLPRGNNVEGQFAAQFQVIVGKS